MEHPQHISNYIKKYLTLAGVEDAVEQGEFDFSNGGTKFVTLAEHDAKYHPGGYDESQDCEKRENMAKADPADTKVKKESKAEGGQPVAASEPPKKEETLAEKRVRWAKRMRGMSDSEFANVIRQYGDEKKYPGVHPVILAERDRRANAEMERWYREHGEQA